MKHSTIIKRLKTRKKNLSLILIFILAFLIGFALTQINPSNTFPLEDKHSIKKSTQDLTPTPSLPPLPKTKVLSNGGYHIFQSFNNCGPAALSMTLKFHGIDASQETLGQELRPYQNPTGDNDDKSVTLQEIAEKSKDFGLTPFLRPMGNPEIIKQFIAYDMPVITRTWTKPDEDIGHFRIIKGYDEEAKTFLQDDSLQNKNLTYTYDEFDVIWKKFNYEYLVLVPDGKIELAKKILGNNIKEEIAWQRAIEYSLQELKENPEDIYTRFNLSVAYHNIGEYQKSVNEFEKVENQLSFRTLWYQIEPIKAYYELENYDKVFQITDEILNNQNRAFSELYILRGKIYQSQGNTELARQEFEKAVQYNINLKEAQDLLTSI